MGIKFGPFTESWFSEGCCATMWSCFLSNTLLRSVVVDPLVISPLDFKTPMPLKIFVKVGVHCRKLERD